DSIDYYLSNTRARSGYDFGVGGATVGDHHLIFLSTLAPVSTTSWSPQYTLAFDSFSDTFTQFDTDIASIAAFSVVSATERSSTSEKESVIMFYSGDFGQ